MALWDKLNTNTTSLSSDSSKGMSKQAKLVCELVADFNSNNLLLQIRNNNRAKSDIDKSSNIPTILQATYMKHQTLKWNC